MKRISGFSWCCTLSLTFSACFVAPRGFAQSPAGKLVERTVDVDLSSYNRQSRVLVGSSKQQLLVTWPMRKDEGEFGRLTLNLNTQKPLIDSLAIAKQANGPADVLLNDVDPVTMLTVGSRQGLRNPGWVRLLRPSLATAFQKRIQGDSIYSGFES